MFKKCVLTGTLKTTLGEKGSDPPLFSRPSSATCMLHLVVKTAALTEVRKFFPSLPPAPPSSLLPLSLSPSCPLSPSREQGPRLPPMPSLLSLWGHQARSPSPEYLCSISAAVATLSQPSPKEHVWKSQLENHNWVLVNMWKKCSLFPPRGTRSTRRSGHPPSALRAEAPVGAGARGPGQDLPTLPLTPSPLWVTLRLSPVSPSPAPHLAGQGGGGRGPEPRGGADWVRIGLRLGAQGAASSLRATQGEPHTVDPGPPRPTKSQVLYACPCHCSVLPAAVASPGRASLREHPQLSLLLPGDSTPGVALCSRW